MEVDKSSAQPTRSTFADIQKHFYVIENVNDSTRKVGKPVRVLSNDVVVIRNCARSTFVVLQNQRLCTVIYQNCTDCKFYMLDSAVVTTRTSRILNCTNCEFIYEDVDVRKVECFNTTNSTVTYIREPVSF